MDKFSLDMYIVFVPDIQELNDYIYGYISSVSGLLPMLSDLTSHGQYLKTSMPMQ